MPFSCTNVRKVYSLRRRKRKLEEEVGEEEPWGSFWGRGPLSVPFSSSIFNHFESCSYFVPKCHLKIKFYCRKASLGQNQGYTREGWRCEKTAPQGRRSIFELCKERKMRRERKKDESKCWPVKWTYLFSWCQWVRFFYFIKKITSFKE